MAEGIDIRFEDREFNRAIDELANFSRRGDIEVLTGQAIQLLRLIANRLTPLTTGRKERKVGFAFIKFTRRGRARAGWWPAWQKIGVRAKPFGTTASGLAKAEGSVVDATNRRDRPFIEMTNEVQYIGKLDDEVDIVGQAVKMRFDDMQNAITKKYERSLKRFSGRGR